MRLYFLGCLHLYFWCYLFFVFAIRVAPTTFSSQSLGYLIFLCYLRHFSVGLTINPKTIKKTRITSKQLRPIKNYDSGS